MSWLERWKTWLDFATSRGKGCVEAPPTEAEWAVARAKGYFQIFRGLGSLELDEVELALALDPRCVEARMIRSSIHETRGLSARRQLADLNRALRLSPENRQALRARGMVKFKLARYHRAIRDLNRALDIEPGDVVARTQRGLAYWRLGDEGKARSDFEAAIGQDPSYSAAFENIGAMYMRRGDWQHALPLLERAQRLAPEDPSHRLNLAVACMELGDDARAFAMLSEMLRARQKATIVENARQLLAKIRARTPDLSTSLPWSVEGEMWTEFAVFSSESTIATLLVELGKRPAYFVVSPLADDRYVACSVYGSNGLREVLTEQADLVGPAILDVEICSLQGLWHTCSPVTRGDDAAVSMRACQDGGGIAVVVEQTEVVGILGKAGGNGPPELPTVLFGARPRFGRDGTRGRPLRSCGRCGSKFPYYAMRVSCNDDLDKAPYRCPHCSADAHQQWLEERLRPGAWSASGFLGEQDSLSEIIDADRARVVALGLSFDDMANRIEGLLDQASVLYDAAAAKFAQIALESGQPAPAAPRGATLVPRCDDLEALRHRARGDGWVPRHWWGTTVGEGVLPPEGAGVRVGDLQVLLSIYAGYQLCPWTPPIRRLDYPAPDLTCRSSRAGGKTMIVVEAGQRLLCGDRIYSHADRDFLIVNRRSGKGFVGSGLIAHLIRDHHFFEGRTRPYRLDLEHAARILGML